MSTCYRIEAKKLEILSLRAQLAAIRARGKNRASSNVAPTRIMNIVASTPKSQQRNTDSCLSSPKLQENSLLSNSWKGKAPPVDLFTDYDEVL